MRTRMVWGMLVVCICPAQTKPPKPEEIDAALRADLRGNAEPSQRPTVGLDSGRKPFQIEPPESRPNRPSARSVSVIQLRHKPPKQALQSVARGARFSQAGDHHRAAAELEKAIARDPEYANAHDRLGVEYAQLGRVAESEVELRRSIVLDPAAWTAHYDLAVTLYRIGDLAGAQQSTRRALDLSSTNAQAHLLLGLLLCGREETRADGVKHLEYAARTILQAKELLDALWRK